MRHAGFDLLPNPHDVCLSFPRHGGALWTRSDLLLRIPYFKALLDSDYADSVTVPAKRVREEPRAKAAIEPPPVFEKDFGDSDDETDDLCFRQNPVQDSEDEAVSEYKRVTITASAFSTYRALLAFLRTGFIAFAPLTSTCAPDPSHEDSRHSRVEAAIVAQPDMPYPVSPKSTYRLADLLSLDDLQRLCLANLANSLTPDSAARKLFDEVSVLHDPWRRAVVDYVVRQWDEVHATEAWREVEKRVEEEEVPGAARVVVQLSRGRGRRPGVRLRDSLPSNQLGSRSSC